MNINFETNVERKFSNKRKYLAFILAATVLYIADGLLTVGNNIKENKMAQCIEATNTININTDNVQLTKPNEAKVVFENHENSKNIAVAIADGRVDKDSNKTYIFILPFNIVMNERGIAVVETAAEALHAKVVGIEQPGLGVSDKAEASWPEVADMILGNFHETSDVVFGVAKQAADIGEGDEIGVIGYSLSATEAAYLANKPGVTDVYLIDPVNSKGVTLSTIAVGMLGVEAGYNYESQNNPYDWIELQGARTEMQNTPYNQLASLGLSAWALSGESIKQELKNYHGDAKIHFVKFGDSALSDIDGMCQIVSETQNTDLSIIDKAHHQQMYSMPFLSQLLKQIK